MAYLPLPEEPLRGCDGVDAPGWSQQAAAQEASTQRLTSGAGPGRLGGRQHSQGYMPPGRCLMCWWRARHGTKRSHGGELYILLPCHDSCVPTRLTSVFSDAEKLEAHILSRSWRCSKTVYLLLLWKPSYAAPRVENQFLDHMALRPESFLSATRHFDPALR